MAGRGTISVNQMPQYGDKTKLAADAKAMTKTPMTGVPYAAPTAGRPATGRNKAVAAQGSQTTTIPPEQRGLMSQLAQAYRTHQYWQGVLAQYPSEFSRMYAEEAAAVYNNLHRQLRNTTPFFE